MIDLKQIKSADDLGRGHAIELAAKELSDRFGVTVPLKTIFYKAWEKAIPEYNLNFSDLKENIERESAKLPHFHLVGNYLNGVSFNDCIENTQRIVQELEII